MGTLRCTRKLLTEIAISSSSLTTSSDPVLESEGEWYANLAIVDRQKYVVFIQPETLFVTASVGKPRRDLRDLRAVFVESLMRTLEHEHLDADVVHSVLIPFQTVILAKTQDRRVMGCLNEVVIAFKWFLEREETVTEVEINRAVSALNRMPWVKTSFIYAIDAMEQYLNQTVGWQGQFERKSRP